MSCFMHNVFITLIIVIFQILLILFVLILSLVKRFMVQINHFFLPKNAIRWLLSHHQIKAPLENCVGPWAAKQNEHKSKSKWIIHASNNNKKTPCHPTDSSFIVKQFQSSLSHVTFKIAWLCDENNHLIKGSCFMKSHQTNYAPIRNITEFPPAYVLCKNCDPTVVSVSVVQTWVCVYPELNVNWWRLMQKGSCGDRGCRCSWREKTRSWCLSK